jgi:hypothetical protein
MKCDIGGENWDSRVYFLSFTLKKYQIKYPRFDFSKEVYMMESLLISIISNKDRFLFFLFENPF